MKNQDYKNAALAALKGHWAPAVVCAITLIAITYAILIPVMVVSALGSSTAASIMSLVIYLAEFLVLYPIVVGYSNAHRLLLVNGDDRMTSNMFGIAFGSYLRNVGGMLLMTVKVALWTFVFIIPGIIKSFSYAMTPYILVDEPELSAAQAIQKSRAMMDGHKFDYFYLQLSFIGWILLSILTLFIGLLWVSPYVMTASASFYEDVKAQYAAKTVTE